MAFYMTCLRNTDRGLHSSLSKGETQPGGAVPDGPDRGSDEDWKHWIHDLGNYGPTAHPIATAAMMRRELGGMFILYFASRI